jgi:hypothetical protein
MEPCHVLDAYAPRNKEPCFPHRFSWQLTKGTAMFAYMHPSNADNFNEWRDDWDFVEVLFERDAYAI